MPFEAQAAEGLAMGPAGEQSDSVSLEEYLC